MLVRRMESGQNLRSGGDRLLYIAQGTITDTYEIICEEHDRWSTHVFGQNSEVLG
jgi:type IV secretory pathway TrbD component